MTRLHPSSLPSWRVWGGLWLGVLVWLGGCSSAQKPAAPPRDVATRLQAVLDQAAAAQQSPGMVMAVRMGPAAPWVGATGCQDEGCRTSECVPLEPPCTDTDVDVTEQDVSNADAAGALISTAGDLLTWTQAFAQGAPVFMDGLRATATTGLRNLVVNPMYTN